MTAVRELVDSAFDAAFGIGVDMRIVAWNAAATALLGYAPNEAIGRPCQNVMQAILPGGVPLCGPDCQFGPCFNQCRPFEIPSCLARHRDGRWVATSFNTLAVPKPFWTEESGEAVAIIFLRAARSSAREHASAKTLRVDQPLCIFTLGHFCLALSGRNLAVETWERKSAATVVKVLSAHVGTAVHRDRLIETLWPDADEKKGRNRIKVTIHFLRQQLGAAGAAGDLIVTLDECYMLRRDCVWVDAQAFERLAAEGSSLLRKGLWSEALRCFEDALALYRGDYLEEDPYADWCAEERARLHEIYFDMLGRIADIHCRQGRFAAAAQTCRTALVREPCREHIHRLLMECLARLGHRDQALAQYDRCQHILAKELGVEPLPETQRLYRDILGHRTPKKTLADRYHRDPRHQ